METCQSSSPTPAQTEWTLFSEAPPAKTCPWPASARAWMESVAGCSSKWLGYANAFNLASSSGRTSQEPLAVTTVEISKLSSVLLRALRLKCRLRAGATPDSSAPLMMRAGGMWLGGCSMRNTSEFHSGAVASSLSQVLETHVASKYFLSPKACAGILRRAEKRGKELPPQLKAALMLAAVDGEATSPQGGGASGIAKALRTRTGGIDREDMHTLITTDPVAGSER